MLLLTNISEKITYMCHKLTPPEKKTDAKHMCRDEASRPGLCCCSDWQ